MDAAGGSAVPPRARRTGEWRQQVRHFFCIHSTAPRLSKSRLCGRAGELGLSLASAVCGVDERQLDHVATWVQGRGLRLRPAGGARSRTTGQPVDRDRRGSRRLGALAAGALARETDATAGRIPLPVLHDESLRVVARNLLHLGRRAEAIKALSELRSRQHSRAMLRRNQERK